MATQDIQAVVNQVNALDAATISSNTTTVGNSVDMQGYESVVFTGQVANYTDGTYTPLLEESDDNSTFTAVADDDLLPTGTGQEASAALGAAGTFKIGYRGTSRYLRLSIVSTSVTTGANVAAFAIQGHPHDNANL